MVKPKWTAKGAGDLHLRDALAVLRQRGRAHDRDYIERWVDELDLRRQRGILLEEARREEEAQRDT